VPFVELKTSVPCPDELADALRTVAARSLRVAENWVLVHITGEQRVFARDERNAAHVDVRVEGAIVATQAEALFTAVTALLDRELGVPPSACFIHVLEVPRQYCGWNGKAM
jgi:phenylpyruvate tautomerase PptA (4-oxalocrotonate tautomerase family)